MSQAAPFFTTTRKRPFVRSTEMSLSKWLAREVNLRKEAIFEGENNDIKEKAWNEIGALASIRFGDKVNVDELKAIYHKEENPDSPGSIKGPGSPSIDSSLLAVIDPDLKVELVEEDEGDKKKASTSPVIPYGGRIPYPAQAYKVIVKEVLRRSSLLIDKSNAKSRTPQANQTRWIAWQEIKQAVIEECGRVIPVEQIQIIWRHQKTKVPVDLVEKAINDPKTVDDRAVDKIFKFYEERERLESKDGDITNLLKDIMGADEKKEIQPLVLPVQANTFLMMSQEGLPILASPVTSSIDDSINAVVKTVTAKEKNHSLVESLVQAQIKFFEETSELQKRQLEVMESFTRTVQMLLEK